MHVSRAPCFTRPRSSCPACFCSSSPAPVTSSGSWAANGAGRCRSKLFFFALAGRHAVVSSGKFRSRLRVFVSKHFFSYRYDYREEWLRFTRTLSDATRVRDVQEQAIRALAEPGGESGWRTVAAASRTRHFVPCRAGTWPSRTRSSRRTARLPRFLERTGWVIDLSEYAADPARYAELEVPAWLADTAVGVAGRAADVGAGLVGFVVLAKSRATIEVNWEVRDLLKAASRQAASYLGQVRATEALVEAQKFDAFNRMSAFVVHDLKNLVAQLSLMLKNAERHRDNPEFQRDMLTTVEHVVGRMNQLMLQLRTGARARRKAALDRPRAHRSGGLRGARGRSCPDRSRPCARPACSRARGPARSRHRPSHPERARCDDGAAVASRCGCFGSAILWSWK